MLVNKANRRKNLVINPLDNKFKRNRNKENFHPINEDH